MTTFDYILLAVAAGVLIYQLNLILRSRREILIAGKSPNRKSILVLLAMVGAVALIRSDDMIRSWPVFAILAVTCLVIFAGGCGVGNRGMFSNGRYIPFTQAAYYQVDDRNGQKLFRLSRLTRETQMLTEAAQLPALLAIMEENGIPEYSDYTKKMAKRASDRAAAAQKKEQQKKKKKK